MDTNKGRGMNDNIGFFFLLYCFWYRSKNIASFINPFKIVRKPVQKLLADTVSSVESYKYKINEYACQRNTKTSYISG